MGKKQKINTEMSMNRRHFLKSASAISLVSGGAGLGLPAVTHAAIKTNAKVVIVGSGLGGIAIANRLK